MTIKEAISDIEALFQSTPSLRKVTQGITLAGVFFDISIHTFLTEGDWATQKCAGTAENFNPHLPYGR